MRPMALRGLRTTRIKKDLATIGMKRDTCISKARVLVSKAPDARAIMALQDVRAGDIIPARCANRWL
jgi:hypothetical protein